MFDRATDRTADGAWDAGLSEEQLAAATHGDGPLVIAAGAGTGKTRTLTARVAALVDRGVDPERILLLTFTRRAADEMLGRAAALCGRRDAARKLDGGTFHAVGHRVVAHHAASLGLTPDPSVLDTADARDLVELLRDDHLTATGRSSTQQRLPSAATIADVCSRAINTCTPAREVIARQFPWCEPSSDDVLAVVRAYQQRKKAQSLLDFDDILLLWRALLADPSLGPALASRHDHVLVDEYQDVNAIQVDIVRLLRPGGVGLTVVGDDAQAVYGFRGASAHHLAAIADDLGATTVRLEQSYRSRQRVLDLANVVRPSTIRLTLRSSRTGGDRPRLVRCHDSSAEARAVVDAVLEARERGLKLRDQAVLFRAAHHSDLLEVELTARRVPYKKFGGLKFFEAAHVKDFVAAARAVDNRVDELAWFRVLRLHDGVGPAKARAVLSVLDPGSPDVDSRHAEAVAAAPARSRTALASTFAAITAARAQGSAAAKAELVLAALRPLVVARYADHPARLADLERLVSSARASTSLAEVVAALTLDPPASTGDLAGPPAIDDDYLVLSTVHSAKGLEWESVHVINAVDGAFPSDMALSSDDGLLEEARLFYVALTRAKDSLAVYTPLRLPHHRRGLDDKHSLAPQSRFLTPEAVAVMDVVEVARPSTPEQTGYAGRVAAPDLDALWA